MPPKICAHVMRGSAEAEATAALGAWVKLVDDFGLAPKFKGRVIGRRIIVYPDQGDRVVTVENLVHLSPLDAALLLWRLMQPTIDANPDITIWEVLNEPVLGDDPAKYKWLAEFSIECMVIFALRHLKCVIFNFSAGTPEPEMWQYLIPAVRYARDNGHYIGLHEYGGVWMWWMCGRFQKEMPQADWSVSPGDAGFTTLRYRSVYNDTLKPLGLDDTRLMITECGLDRVGPAPDGFESGSWRFVAGQWGAWDGSKDPIDYWRGTEIDAERYYAEQLIWYDRELRRDPYVEAAFVFTFGSVNYDDYNLNGTRVARHLLDYMRREAHVADPIPEPTPPPPPHEPLPARFKPGDKAMVTPGDLLNVRLVPGGDDVGDLNPGDVITIEGGPIKAAHGGIVYDWYAHSSGVWSISDRLELFTPEPDPTPEPEPTMPNEIVYSNDWTDGQEAIAGHDNIRVPKGFEIEYLDGTSEPHLPGADRNSNYMAPESTMRSGDTVKYPFTERLPDAELGLYLAPDAPIVEHWFKRYGKQWWTLSKRLTLPAGQYKFAVEVYPDIYSGNHVWAPDPLSGEYVAFIGTTFALPMLNGKFGQWVELTALENHTGGEFVHGVMFRARYGVETVGIFIRRWKVTRIGDVTPPSDPPPPPTTTGPDQATLARWAKTMTDLGNEMAQWVE